jgi:hypothetical protein
MKRYIYETIEKDIVVSAKRNNKLGKLISFGESNSPIFKRILNDLVRLSEKVN